jgi:hypothetical protein
VSFNMCDLVTLLNVERQTLLLRDKGKVKVNYLCALTKHHAMKEYWGSGCVAPRIRRPRQ